MLDGLLGGVVGAEMATVVNGLIEKHGGVQGIVAQLEQQGLGGTVRSWVSTGANQPISADQIHQVFGSDLVKQMAAKVGMSPEDLAAKLSHILPQAIDKLTPAGVVPKAWRSATQRRDCAARRRGRKSSRRPIRTQNPARAPGRRHAQSRCPERSTNIFPRSAAPSGTNAAPAA
jgi:uncharacterized protein YidB (DUF937 family)